MNPTAATLRHTIANRPAPRVHLGPADLRARLQARIVANGWSETAAAELADIAIQQRLEARQAAQAAAAQAHAQALPPTATGHALGSARGAQQRPPLWRLLALAIVTALLYAAPYTAR